MQIKGKIKHRYDTLSNWTRDNIVLLRGELAIIDCGDQTRFKVGNGISAFTQLPFIDEHALSTSYVEAYDIGQSAQANSTPFGLASGQRLSINETLKTVKTRIALKTDTLSNWSTSTLQLYNGEIALGYDSTTGKYEVRIGTAEGKTWSELSSSNIVLSSKNILNLAYDSYELSNVTSAGSKEVKFQLIGRDPTTQNKIAIGSPIAISSTVYVENGSDTFNQLSVIKISKSDFDAKVGSGSPIQGNVLYVVDSDIIDAYGQQMKNLGDPTDLSDAATKGYVDKTKEDLSTDYTRLIGSLSDKIDKKIYIEDKISSEISGYSDLSVIKLSSNEYQSLVSSKATLSNALYIVESDFVNAYGQQIKNLSAPELSSDAATKGYVDSSIVNVNTSISDVSSDLLERMSQISGDLGEIISSKIYIEDRIGKDGELVSGYSDLSIIKLSSNEYQDLVDSDATLSNALYVVESDFVNAYGQQIKNLANPNDLSDAATKGYVDKRFNLISSNSILSSVFNSINAGGVGVITLEQSICAIYELVKILGYRTSFN